MATITKAYSASVRELYTYLQKTVQKYLVWKESFFFVHFVNWVVAFRVSYSWWKNMKLFFFHVPLISCAKVKRRSTPEIQIKITLAENSFTFRRVRKLWKATITFAMSCLSLLHGTTRLPRDGFSWYFKFESFSKICREDSTVIKIWQE